MNRERGGRVVYDKQQHYSIVLEPLCVNIQQAQHRINLKSKLITTLPRILQIFLTD